MVKSMSAKLFARITAGFDGDIRYIRLSKRCLIAWYVPIKRVSH